MLLSFFVLYPGEGKGKRLKIPAVSAGGENRGGRIAAVCRLFRLLSLSLIPLGVFFCFLFEFPVPSAAAVNSPAGGGVWRQKERRRRRGGGVGVDGRRSHFLFLRLFPPGGGVKERSADLPEGYFPQHFLYFFPLPQGQGSFRPIFGSVRTKGFCGTILPS